jgi:hypothetical protein
MGCDRIGEHIFRAHAFWTTANPCKIYTKRECSGKGPTRCSSSRGTVAPTGTPVGAHHAESSRTGALRSSSAHSPAAHADVARATVLQRTSAHAVRGASAGQGP